MSTTTTRVTVNVSRDVHSEIRKEALSRGGVPIPYLMAAAWAAWQGLPEGQRKTLLARAATEETAYAA